MWLKKVRARRRRRKESNETNFVKFGALYKKLWIFEDKGIYWKINIKYIFDATVPEGTVAMYCSYHCSREQYIAL